jgi:hypothetical protein
MQLALCRHIKTNGTRCKSPSLIGGLWCYFHHHLHQRHNTFRPTAATRGYLIPGQHIELSALEDRESVQVALSVVINALATGQLDTRRATALLYGLQLASQNARGLQTRPFAPDVVRSVESSPEGLDLAEPGATVDADDFYHFDDDEEADEEADEEDGEEADEEEQFSQEQFSQQQFSQQQPVRFLETFPVEPSLPSPANRFVVAERDHQVDAGGSASGDVTG